MAEITLVITTSLPPSALTTLRNIGHEAAEYIAAQAGLAGFEPTVSCFVGEAEHHARVSFDPPAAARPPVGSPPNPDSSETPAADTQGGTSGG